MKKIFLLFFSFLVSFLLSPLSLFNPERIHAACSFSLSPTSADPQQNTVFTVTASEGGCFVTTLPYYVYIYPQEKDGRPGEWTQYFGNVNGVQSIDGVNLIVGADFPSEQYKITNYQNKPWVVRVCAEQLVDCANKPDATVTTQVFTMTAIIAPTPTPLSSTFPVVEQPTQCIYQRGSSINVRITNLEPNRRYIWWWNGDFVKQGDIPAVNDTSTTYTIPPDKTDSVGEKTFCVGKPGASPVTAPCGKGSSNSVTFKFTPTPPSGDTSCTATNIISTPIPPFNPTSCPVGEEGNDCRGCVGSDPKNPQGIWTGLGCIQTSPVGLIGNIFGIVLGLAGGIALLLIIYSGYRMMTATGNPEAIQGARETMTAAIVGLLFIIFSFVILEIIGVDILRIPQFGGTGRFTTNDGRELPQQCLDARYALSNVTLCGEDIVRQACNNVGVDLQDAQEGCDRGNEQGCQALARYQELLTRCQESGF